LGTPRLLPKSPCLHGRALFVGDIRRMIFYGDSSQIAQVSPSIYAYHFIIDETIETKRLINALYQVVNRFM